MKRTLFVVAVLFAFATSANAASLTVVSDKTTYNVGETITLTVTGDDDGASTYGIYGRLIYSGASVDSGTRTQTQLTGVYGKWATQPLTAADTGAVGSNSEAFSQLAGTYAMQANNLPGMLSTVTLIAAAAGVVDVAWETQAPGFQLLFFGLTNAPGTSFTIIPEPTTVALLGLGLIGLALGGRRRS